MSCNVLYSLSDGIANPVLLPPFNCKLILRFIISHIPRYKLSKCWIFSMICTPTTFSDIIPLRTPFSCYCNAIYELFSMSDKLVMITSSPKYVYSIAVALWRLVTRLSLPLTRFAFAVIQSLRELSKHSFHEYRTGSSPYLPKGVATQHITTATT